MLRRAVKDFAPQFRSEFAAAQPFRHVVIEDFFDAGFCERLIAEFPPFEARNAVNELGEPGRKAVVTDVAGIGSAYRELDGLVRSREFLKWLGDITGIDALLYDPDYIGGGTHENTSGQDLDFHVDFNYHPLRPLHRRLNLIVFLNPEWNEEWGGCLELQQDPWKDNTPGRRILPLANRAVLFETTEHSWHGFHRIWLPADRPGITRRSIAFYFYSKERPSAEIAASHGTVYAPRPLPEHLEAGYTLQAEDVHELQILMARRNRQIQYLYERELDFSKALEGAYRSPSFRLGRALTWPLRKLRGQR